MPLLDGEQYVDRVVESRLTVLHGAYHLAERHRLSVDRSAIDREGSCSVGVTTAQRPLSAAPC